MSRATAEKDPGEGGLRRGPETGDQGIGGYPIALITEQLPVTGSSPFHDLRAAMASYGPYSRMGTAASFRPRENVVQPLDAREEHKKLTLTLAGRHRRGPTAARNPLHED